jgi:hypothetical protein
LVDGAGAFEILVIDPTETADTVACADFPRRVGLYAEYRLMGG